MKCFLQILDGWSILVIQMFHSLHTELWFLCSPGYKSLVSMYPKLVAHTCGLREWVGSSSWKESPQRSPRPLSAGRRCRRQWRNWGKEWSHDFLCWDSWLHWVRHCVPQYSCSQDRLRCKSASKLVKTIINISNWLHGSVYRETFSTLVKFVREDSRDETW